MNIVLLGSPASGKGTQAELLAKKFGLYILATGEEHFMLMMHKAKKNGGFKYPKAKAFMNH